MTNGRYGRMLILWLATGWLPASVLAQSRDIDLGAVFDVVKNVARSQSVASIGQEEEIRIGRDVAASVLNDYPLIQNDPLQRQLNQIGLWIALQSSRPDLPWRFAAVKSDQINAFAAPGGTILVTSGMLGHVTNEAELACVLGHEIGHTVHRHHLAVLQKSLLVAAGASALSAASKSTANEDIRRRLLAEGKEIFTRGLDRGAEREADEEGVLLAARAGYDPAACADFMQRLASLKPAVGPLEALYKTHPPAADRVTDITRAVDRLAGIAPGSGARPPLTLKAPDKK